MLRKLIVAAGIAALVGVAPASAQRARPQVVASFSILANIAANVAGDAADVVSLMPPGANPHAYEPSAQDVVLLSDADTVLIVGANFEEGLLPVLEESAGENTVVVSTCVPMRPIVGDGHAHTDAGGTPDPANTTGDQCAAHAEAVTGAFGIETLAPPDTLGPLHTLDCDAERCDPHVWTDPVNAGLWALTIRDTLAGLDPDHAAEYAANADAYLADLATTSANVQAMIDTIPEDRRYLVTNHQALNYFAARYGLPLIGVIIPGGSTTSEPSVQEVLALVETITTYDVPAIFTETTVSEDLARQIADETGADIVPLYTGSLSLPGEGAGTYLEYLLYNATAMADALTE